MTSQLLYVEKERETKRDRGVRQEVGSLVDVHSPIRTHHSHHYYYYHY